MSPDELLNLGFSKELVVFVTSALPILELRGALPLAINAFHLPWYHALPLAVAGNLLPVPFILLFLNGASRIIARVPVLDRMLAWLFERTRRRGTLIERYERIGLALFVAIPLPVTGAWTGSLAAVLFGMGFRHAFLSIFCGVVVAGAIVTCLSLLGWVGAVIAGVAISGVAIYGMWKA